MTQPRAQLAPAGASGTFHCVQRCVRRAFLCGVDGYTGRSFEHRKHWIEQRLQVLAECFAISVHAYAVMSNHLHIVVELVPEASAAWSDEEVASRWVRLFPPRENSDRAIAGKCLQLFAQPQRLRTIRARLSDLSWLMRCLAEPIARRANREDHCKGRFWEGRFKAQRLCDERAVLAAMAYVDLNPIRAGLADRLDNSDYNSVARRMVLLEKTPDRLTAPLGPIMGMLRPNCSVLNTADYLQLLNWTGRQIAFGKRGHIAADAPSILHMIECSPQRWTQRVLGIGNGYWRVVGTAEDLIGLAKRIGQRWLKGLAFARSFD